MVIISSITCPKSFHTTGSPWRYALLIPLEFVILRLWQKLIKRMVCADHVRVLTERQDAVIQKLEKSAKENFEKAQQDHQRAVEQWRMRALPSCGLTLMVKAYRTSTRQSQGRGSHRLGTVYEHRFDLGAGYTNTRCPLWVPRSDACG
jgi:hypothetical protein